MQLRTDAAYIVKCTIKDGVTISYGQTVVFTGTDDEVDLPAGNASLLVAGQALEGGTGNAAGTVKIDVAIGGPSLPGIAAGAISAGNTVITDGSDGTVAAGTTAGAIVGTALNNTTTDGDRVWIRR